MIVQSIYNGNQDDDQLGAGGRIVQCAEAGAENTWIVIFRDGTNTIHT
jgi:hypothetical protein